MSALVALAGLGLVGYLMFQKEERYETPDPTPPIPITHELIQRLVQVTQPALVKKLGASCVVYPLETSYVRQDGDVFHCRFMFTVADGKQYPYGLGVSADVKGNEVVSLELQNQNTIDKIDPFDQFMTGSQLSEQVLPTKSQLQNAFSTV
jgi:hypothetical protein